MAIDLTKRNELSRKMYTAEMDTNLTVIETYLNALGDYSEVSIGDWNMDTTASVNVAHGLSATEWKTMRNLSWVIRDDADAIYTHNDEEIFIDVDSTNIVISRTNAGTYDSTDYDSTSYNRGYVNFFYTAD